MLDPASASLGEEKEHHLVYYRFSRFSSREFFLESKDSFFHPTFIIVHDRARLTLEGKSVVLMSVPVSI